MIIRQCREPDVALLERHIPSPGRNRYHEERFLRHQAGISTFLVVYLDDVPVGSGEVRWQGCDDPEVRRRYPGCPELNGLTVWPPERQSRGIGTALVREAENIARQRGRRQLGLGVADDNPRAAALYLRLGYQETGCRYVGTYPFVDDHGIRHEIAESCRFLVRSIQGGHADVEGPTGPPGPAGRRPVAGSAQ
ncbi:GNAT family N-acetyltransferase [Plantactinospora solaniradicis]|uniref:GNAT family N-acetyltransferase n=1 Tax=Plantactinospora solaniradicis TaxID=1723736 RepID=A0ABW1K6S8_9ACTN